MRDYGESGYYENGAYVAPIQAAARSVRDVSADEAVEVAECILMDAAENQNEGTSKELAAPHLVMVINAGATMRGLEEKLARHANRILVDHKALDARTIATIILFGEEIAIIAERVHAGSLPPFVPEMFGLPGCGILMDVLATVVSYLEGCTPCSDEHMKVSIITGCSEPASCAVSYTKALALLEAKRAAGWEFELLTV